MQGDVLGTQENSLVGAGVYTIAEAALLTGVPAALIRRWGSDCRSRKFDAIDGQPILRFLDLMELRFVAAFRRHKIAWAAIGEAARQAAIVLDDPHPFARKRFQTDGKRIFARIDASADLRLFDAKPRSWDFGAIVDASLYAGLDFERDQVARWYPMHPARAIEVDPARSFGRPITIEGVPTDILDAALAAAGGNAETAAGWYDVPAASVRAAAAFEARLRSAGAAVEAA